ncbi:MAG: MarR family winged helix-turn-helix transcriptional regulator [Thalassobaculaceae bacterium]|nr:MarR family winged helix-turn-helix transcriptional regulator [Thalassobaculaceae bacterium]
MSGSSMDPIDDTGLACTCSAVRGAARRLTQYYDEALKETGLKVTQYGLMANIARMDRPSVTDLADRVSMDRTTLTRNLAPLRDAGWVNLAPGPDKRTRSVVLTPSGRRILETARPHWRAAETALRHRAGGDITKDLHDVLVQTVAAVEVQQAQ